MTLEVVVGIPGSGKTSYLLDKVGELVKQSVPLNEIAFLTMTRNARLVARQRMFALGASEDDLVFFRTMHSIAHELLGRPTLVTEKDRKDFCKELKIDYSEEEESLALGRIYFNIYDSMRSRACKDITATKFEDFDEAWIHSVGRVVDDPSALWKLRDSRKAWNFMRSWELWKRAHERVDYTDMLVQAFSQGLKLPAKFLFVDEFQDLNPLMYELYKVWAKDCQKVVIGGDEDQCIYDYMGANPAFLMKEREKADQFTPLSASHRCPSVILEFAGRVIHRNKQRLNKDMMSLQDGGEVTELIEPTPQRIASTLRSCSTLLLCRTNAQALSFSEMLDEAGLPHRGIDQAGHWSDRFIYLLNASLKLTSSKPEAKNLLTSDELLALIDALPAKPYLQHGVKAKAKKGEADLTPNAVFGMGIYQLHTMNDYANALDLTPRQQEILRRWRAGPVKEIHLRVGTIHKAKGDEADDVLLFTGFPDRIAMQLRVQAGMESERRVRYVGLTRARKRLVLVRPLTRDYKEF